jgi:hypothetical protein
MWLFKRKKSGKKDLNSAPLCPGCGSNNTKLVVYHGTDQPDYVKVWRGKRSLTFRCSDCGQDFYVDEPPGGIEEQSSSGDGLIDDEDALRTAEEELKKQIDREDDRRFR